MLIFEEDQNLRMYSLSRIDRKANEVLTYLLPKGFDRA
jgi:hypothetical protein